MIDGVINKIYFLYSLRTILFKLEFNVRNNPVKVNLKNFRTKCSLLSENK